MSTQETHAALEGGAIPKSSIRVMRIIDGLVLANVGRLCIGVWRKSSTRERFNVQRECLTEVVNLHPDGGGYLMVVEQTSDPPDDEIRRASAAMVTELGSKLTCVACVMEGTGFRSAILRTVLSGIIFLIRSRSTIRVFHSVGAAAAWLSEQLRLSSAPLLVRQVEAIREHLDRGPLDHERRDVGSQTRLKEAASVATENGPTASHSAAAGVRTRKD